MQLQNISFIGPPIDDVALLARLPADLAGFLQQINGFIQFGGGLHVRGACREPAWHSLRDAWEGENAFHRLHPNEVRSEDIPFAEDCIGDQYLLREGLVWKLAAETGEVTSLDVALGDFLASAQADPIEYLGMHPLLQFQQDSGRLEPGQLLGAYPPFCTQQSGDRVHLAAIPAGERRGFLAEFARQIRDVPDGTPIRIKIIRDADG
jgi:hypothetical protein